MNEADIQIEKLELRDLSSDADIERALDADNHGSFLRRAAGAGNLYVARLGGVYAGGIVLGGTHAAGAVFDGSFFGRGFVWLIWVEESFRRNGVASALMRRAEEIGAPPAAPYLVRGTLAGREDQWARSLWLAERGLQVVPDDPNLLTLECMALLKLKQSEAALGVAARLAAMMPGTDPVDILREIAGVGARRPNMRRPPPAGP